MDIAHAPTGKTGVAPTQDDVAKRTDNGDGQTTSAGNGHGLAHVKPALDQKRDGDEPDAGAQ